MLYKKLNSHCVKRTFTLYVYYYFFNPCLYGDSLFILSSTDPSLLEQYNLYMNFDRKHIIDYTKAAHLIG